MITVEQFREACEHIRKSLEPRLPIEPTRCFCGARLGENPENCYWCKEYREVGFYEP